LQKFFKNPKNPSFRVYINVYIKTTFPSPLLDSLCRPYKEVDQLQELYIKALLCEIGDNERSAFKGISALERQLPTFPKQILYSMIKLNQTKTMHIFICNFKKTSDND
jgi:hypothetical protein